MLISNSCTNMACFLILCTLFMALFFHFKPTVCKTMLQYTLQISFLRADKSNWILHIQTEETILTQKYSSVTKKKLMIYFSLQYFLVRHLTFVKREQQTVQVFNYIPITILALQASCKQVQTILPSILKKHTKKVSILNILAHYVHKF